MPNTIDIVEPTLVNEAGHCYSFIESFCGAKNDSSTLRLWVGKKAELSFADRNIEIRKHFGRHLRRLQSYLLYRRLLSKATRIFVSTAGRTDLLLIDLASKRTLPSNKVYLYFHWFRATDGKLQTLKRIALKQPNLHILGPTESVIKIFRNAGFANAQVVSYPVMQHEIDARTAPVEFSHLLFAGAARHDKGFSHVVDLVAYLQESEIQLPVLLQTSAEHYGKYDAKTKKAIDRLSQIGYIHLSVNPDTLDRTEYLALFAGAICLQLYDTADFADRVSGVTLDAFSAGCPIIASADTWMARMAQRFGAGEAVVDMSPPSILKAIQRIIADYAHYNEQALAAGKALQIENSAASLFRAITM